MTDDPTDEELAAMIVADEPYWAPEVVRRLIHALQRAHQERDDARAVAAELRKWRTWFEAGVQDELARRAQAAEAQRDAIDAENGRLRHQMARLVEALEALLAMPTAVDRIRLAQDALAAVQGGKE